MFRSLPYRHAALDLRGGKDRDYSLYEAFSDTKWGLFVATKAVSHARGMAVRVSYCHSVAGPFYHTMTDSFDIFPLVAVL